MKDNIIQHNYADASAELQPISCGGLSIRSLNKAGLKNSVAGAFHYELNSWSLPPECTESNSGFGWHEW